MIDSIAFVGEEKIWGSPILAFAWLLGRMLESLRPLVAFLRVVLCFQALSM